MGNNAIVRIPFVSDGNPVRLAIPCNVDYIKVFNKTVANVNNPAIGTYPLLAVESDWFPDMAPGSAICKKKVTASNNIEMPPVTSGGFKIINDANPGSNPTIALANPANTAVDDSVWSTTPVHGLVAGDIVRLANTTGALQYSGIDLSITAAPTTTSFTTLLNAAGYAVATGGTVRKINYDVSLYYPRRRYIANIVTGSTTTIRLTVRHQFKVDEYVRFIVPASFGMVQLNGLRGRILSVDNTLAVNTIVVDVDSTSFNAFAFPLSTAFPNFGLAQVVPDAEFPGIISASVRNTGIKGIELGSVLCGNVVATVGDKMEVIAFQADQVSPFYAP